MAQKYQSVVNTTAGDRFAGSALAFMQMSDGTPVWLAQDPSNSNQLGLFWGDRTSIYYIGVVSSFWQGPLAGVAMCRDDLDNIYIVGSWAPDSRYAQVQQWSNYGTHNWRPCPVGRAPSAAYGGGSLQQCAATWCKTGGGTGGYGHLLVIWSDNIGNNFYNTLDVGRIAQGVYPFVATNFAYGGINPYFLGGGTTAAAAGGANIDLANEGFGATSGWALIATSATAICFGSWGVASSGALSYGSTGGQRYTSLAFSGSGVSLGNGTKIRLVRYAPGCYAMIYPSNSATVNGLQVYTYVPGYSNAVLDPVPITGGFPAPSNGNYWDVQLDPFQTTPTMYIYAMSTTTGGTMLGTPITLSTTGGAATAAAPVTIDTAVGGSVATASRTIRAVKNPVTVYGDAQVYDNASPYSAAGDWWTLPATPLAPTLTTPLPGAVTQFTSGGTLSWTIGTIIPKDTQSGYYLRRLAQTQGATYEYWNAGTSAWQATEVLNSSASTSVVFGAGKWAQNTSYSWAVKTVNTNSGGTVGPYSNDSTLTVAYPPPTTPALTAVFDAVLNRTVITVDDGNLLTVNQSTLSTDTTGWLAGSNSTIARVASPSLDTAGALQITATAAGTAAAQTPYNTSGLAIVPGRSYSVSAAIQPTAAGRTVVLSMTYYGSTGLLVGAGQSSSALGVTNGQYTALSFSSVAPQAAMYLGITVAVQGMAAAEVAYMDEIGVYPGTIAPAWQIGGGLGITGLVEYSDNAQPNLLSADSASIYDALALGWIAGANTTLARSTVASLPPGDGSLALTASGPTALSASTAVGAGGVSVVAQAPYSALASFQASTVGRSCQVGVIWYDANGVQISTTLGTAVNDVAGSWVQATWSGSSPNGAAFAAAYITIVGAAGAETHYMDGAQLASGTVTTWSPGVPDAGWTWNTLRGGSGLSTLGGPVTVYDYEAPVAQQRQYRASTSTASPGGTSFYALAQSTGTVTAYWLGDPLDNTSWVQLNVVPGTFATTKREAQTVHLPLGRGLPVIIADSTTTGEDGTATVWTGSDIQEAALKKLLDSQRVLLLQSPELKQWYIRRETDHPVARPYPGTTDRYREHAISWREVGRP